MIIVDIITWMLFLGLGTLVTGFVISFGIVLIKGLRNIFQDFKMPEGIDLGFCQIKFKKKDQSLLNSIKANTKSAREKQEDEEEAKFPKLWKNILADIAKASSKGLNSVMIPFGSKCYDETYIIETNYLLSRVRKQLKKEGFKSEYDRGLIIWW